MIETLFKLGCLMFACFIASAYLILAVEETAIARKSTAISVKPSETPSGTEKQKSCECCAARMARLRAQILQARKRAQTQKPVINPGNPSE